MSPKIVNGSFAAIFDQGDFLFEIAKKIAQLKLNQGKGSPGNKKSTNKHGHFF